MRAAIKKQPRDISIEFAIALKKLELGHVGHAVYELENALCLLGIHSEVRALTGPLTIRGDKDGLALEHASPEWFDLLRNDPWVRMN